MFCIFLNVRYANEKLMQVGHDYLTQNFDPDSLSGFISLKGYHISPDKGLGIITFDTQKNLEKNVPELKKVFSDYEQRFNCKIIFDTGIENKEMFIN